MDQFFKIVTGDRLAFWKVCQALPETIEKVIEDLDTTPAPYDTVYDGLVEIGNASGRGFVDALYLLGFSSYIGFGDIQSEETGLSE